MLNEDKCSNDDVVAGILCGDFVWNCVCGIQWGFCVRLCGGCWLVKRRIVVEVCRLTQHWESENPNHPESQLLCMVVADFCVRSAGSGLSKFPAKNK